MRRWVRAVLMVLSVPFVMVAVALGWRPKRSSEEPESRVERTSLSPRDAAQVALMKFASWIEGPQRPPQQQVERLADHLLDVELAELAGGPLDRILAEAEQAESDVTGLRQRALGLALVAWGESGSDAVSAHAVELGRTCLAIGLAAAGPPMSRPHDLPGTRPHSTS